MGNFAIILEDELEERFEQAVLKKFGHKRGNKKKAVEEAITDWITKNS